MQSSTKVLSTLKDGQHLDYGIGFTKKLSTSAKCALTEYLNSCELQCPHRHQLQINVNQNIELAGSSLFIVQFTGLNGF